MVEESSRAASICQLLDETYRRPDLGNLADPVDELIYILLSTMTTEVNYQRSFAALQARYQSWEGVLRASVEEVEATISTGGLAPTKARNIQALLQRILHDWGALDLSFMHAWPTVEIRRYLVGLPGVGYKAATCVLAYSFSRDVCPVDTHTYRTAIRLGVVPLDAPEIGWRAHIRLEGALPIGERLSFHINAVAHGRQRCFLDRPRCDGCPVVHYCLAPAAGRYSRRDGPLPSIALDGDPKRA
ncbi:MAG TPA: hypothetical protein VLA19_09060 [Herpetosiphonaceae bacterium]|nr:hypothetical protein [Herpetosiphonaceae bacterium]